MDWKALRLDCILVAERESLQDFAERKGKKNMYITANEPEIIPGFQLSFVEQWICDRTRSYNTVIAYTGNSEHKVKLWPATFPDLETLQTFFHQYPVDCIKSVEYVCQNEKRANIVIAIMSKFPSKYNLVEIPGGDYSEYLQKMFVSLNMKRMGCSGRAAVSLTHPVETQEKFRGLFKIHGSVQFELGVLEVVRLVQCSLKIFGTLRDSVDCDGLICDDTQEALCCFQKMIGLEQMEKGVYFVPKVVLYLLCAVIFSRYSLSLTTIQNTVPKDPFSEIEAFRKVIRHFQELKGLPQTGRLSPDLLNQMEKANKKILKIPIHGMGKFGADWEKELPDFDAFNDLINVDRPDRLRYIWLGKGKYQGVAESRSGKSFRDSIFGRPLEGAVGFVKGVGEQVTETFSNKVDEIKDSYKTVKDNVRLPHRREKDREKEKEKDRNNLHSYSHYYNYNNYLPRHLHEPYSPEVGSQESVDRHFEQFPSLNQFFFKFF